MSYDCKIDASTPQLSQKFEEKDCNLGVKHPIIVAAPGAPIASPASTQFTAEAQPKAPKPQAAGNSLLKRAPQVTELDAERYGSRILGLVREGFAAIARGNLVEAEGLYKEALRQHKEFKEFNPEADDSAKSWFYRLAALKTNLMAEQAKQGEASGKSAEEIKVLRGKVKQMYRLLRSKAKKDANAKIAVADLAKNYGKDRMARRQLSEVIKASSDDGVRTAAGLALGELEVQETGQLIAQSKLRTEDLAPEDQSKVTIQYTDQGEAILAFKKEFANFGAAYPEEAAKLIRRVKQTALHRLGQQKCENGTHHYYKARSYQEQGNREAALLAWQDFYEASAGTENKEIKGMRAEARDILRKNALAGLEERLPQVIGALEQQRSGGERPTTSHYRNQELLSGLRMVIKEGVIVDGNRVWPVTIDEALKLLPVAYRNAHEDFWKDPHIKEGWGVALPEAGGELQDEEQRASEERRVANEVFVPLAVRGDVGKEKAAAAGVKTIHIDGGTAEVPAGRKAAAGYRFVIGKKGGQVQLAHRLYTFPPADRERVVYVQRSGGRTEMLVKADIDHTEEPLHNRGTVRSERLGVTAGDKRKQRLDFLERAAKRLDGLKSADPDLYRYLHEIEGREGLEKMSSPTAKREYIYEQAKLDRHRTGSYELAADKLRHILAPHIETALTSISASEQEKILEEEQQRDSEIPLEKRVCDRLLKLAFAKIDQEEGTGRLDNKDKLAANAWRTYVHLMDPLDETMRVSDAAADQWADVGLMMASALIGGAGAKNIITTFPKAIPSLAEGGALILSRGGGRIAGVRGAEIAYDAGKWVLQRAGTSVVTTGAMSPGMIAAQELMHPDQIGWRETSTMGLTIFAQQLGANVLIPGAGQLTLGRFPVMRQVAANPVGLFGSNALSGGIVDATTAKALGGNVEEEVLFGLLITGALAPWMHGGRAKAPEAPQKLTSAQRKRLNFDLAAARTPSLRRYHRLLNDPQTVREIRAKVRKELGGRYKDIGSIDAAVERILKRDYDISPNAVKDDVSRTQNRLREAGLIADNLAMAGHVNSELARLEFNFYPDDVPIYRSTPEARAGRSGEDRSNLSFWGIGDRQGALMAEVYGRVSTSRGEKPRVITRSTMGNLRSQGAQMIPEYSAMGTALKVVHANDHVIPHSIEPDPLPLVTLRGEQPLPWYQPLADRPIPLVRPALEDLTAPRYPRAADPTMSSTRTSPSSDSAALDPVVTRELSAPAAVTDGPPPPHIIHAFSDEARYVNSLTGRYISGPQSQVLVRDAEAGLLDAREALRKLNQITRHYGDLEEVYDVTRSTSEDARAAARERVITNMSRYLASDLEGLQVIRDRLQKHRLLLLENIKKHQKDMELKGRAQTLMKQLNEIDDAIGVLKSVQAGDIPENLNIWMASRLKQVEYSKYYQATMARNRAANKAYAGQRGSQLVLRLMDLEAKHPGFSFKPDVTPVNELAPYINDGEPHLSFRGLPDGVSAVGYKIRFVDSRTRQLIEARITSADELAQVLENNHWSTEDITPIHKIAAENKNRYSSIPPRPLEDVGTQQMRQYEEATGVHRLGGRRPAAAAESARPADVPIAVQRDRVVDDVLASLDKEYRQLFSDKPEVRVEIKAALERELTDGLFDAHNRLNRPESELLETGRSIADRVLAPYLTQ